MWHLFIIGIWHHFWHQTSIVNSYFQKLSPSWVPEFTVRPCFGKAQHYFHNCRFQSLYLFIIRYNLYAHYVSERHVWLCVVVCVVGGCVWVCVVVSGRVDPVQVLCVCVSPAGRRKRGRARRSRWRPGRRGRAARVRSAGARWRRPAGTSPRHRRTGRRTCCSAHTSGGSGGSRRPKDTDHGLTNIKVTRCQLNRQRQTLEKRAMIDSLKERSSTSYNLERNGSLEIGRLHKTDVGTCHFWFNHFFFT